jgi:hypothetical protein
MNLRTLLLAPLLSIAVIACAADTDGSAATPAAAVAADGQPIMIVHKTPWCGCCEVWAKQAEEAGFAIEMRDVEDMGPIKQALGVPGHQASCHTAEVDGYFVEGHVPFQDIRRLLAERPDARGIAVPGMPLGSPGMEADIKQAYSVNLVAADGSISEYARHNEDAANGHHGHDHGHHGHDHAQHGHDHAQHDHAHGDDHSH